MPVKPKKTPIDFFKKGKRRMINFLPPVSRLLLEREFKKILKQRKFWGDILEVGAGQQPIKKILKPANYKTYKNLDIKNGPQVDIVANIQQTNLAGNSFDTIIAKEVLEHLANPFQAAAEIYRLLKPGGLFIGSTRFIYPYHGLPNDYFRFTKFGLEEIFKDFAAATIISQGSWLTNLWDNFTYSIFFWPGRIFNSLFMFFDYKNSLFPAGFIIIARKGKKANL